MKSPVDRLTPGERLLHFVELRRLHRDDRCILMVEDAGELRPPRSPAELRSRGCVCVVCGRQPELDDEIVTVIEGGA
jgi:hypothetical protein